MSMTAVPISIRRVRAPIAASSGNGEASCRSKWCTRTNAPSTPMSSAACASSTVCSSESAALRVCDPGTSRQCPNERNPIFFTPWISAASPARIPGPSAPYRPSAPLRTPATKAFHGHGSKAENGASGFLLSLTSMRAPCGAATSRQLPLP